MATSFRMLSYAYSMRFYMLDTNTRDTRAYTMIIENIISQHAEESAFLWLLRDDAVKAPHYNLKDLKALEGRVEAHLDGLRVAGEAAWPFCEEGLKQEEAGELFAAGYTALDNSREDWLSQTLEVVEAAPETARGLISALGWVPKEQLQGHVLKWLQSEKPLHNQLGVSACAIQRVDCGAYLKNAIDSNAKAVRSRALRSVGEIRRRDLLPMLVEHLQDEDIDSRFWSSWSATLLGDAGGLEMLRGFVGESDYSVAALALALRAMDKSAAIQWVRDLSRDTRFQRLVVEAAGVIGDPVSIPWLLSNMENPELVRVAGEAFSQITGIDLAYDDLDRDEPEGFEAGPTDNPEDEDVAMDQDEDLPWPDPAILLEWWERNQKNYPAGQRLLCGQPVSQSVCTEVLRQGFQRQRRSAAIELALLNSEEPLFNTSATARRQERLLG